MKTHKKNNSSREGSRSIANQNTQQKAYANGLIQAKKPIAPDNSGTVLQLAKLVRISKGKGKEGLTRFEMIDAEKLSINQIMEILDKNQYESENDSKNLVEVLNKKVAETENDYKAKGIKFAQDSGKKAVSGFKGFFGFGKEKTGSREEKVSLLDHEDAEYDERIDQAQELEKAGSALTSKTVGKAILGAVTHGVSSLIDIKNVTHLLGSFSTVTNVSKAYPELYSTLKKKAASGQVAQVLGYAGGLDRTIPMEGTAANQGSGFAGNMATHGNYEILKSQISDIMEGKGKDISNDGFVVLQDALHKFANAEKTNISKIHILLSGKEKD